MTASTLMGFCSTNSFCTICHVFSRSVASAVGKLAAAPTERVSYGRNTLGLDCIYTYEILQLIQLLHVFSCLLSISGQCGGEAACSTKFVESLWKKRMVHDCFYSYKILQNKQLLQDKSCLLSISVQCGLIFG